MTSEHYRSLISKFCTLVGLDPVADATCSTGSFMCKEVAFSLLPIADQPETISVYVEFGQIPPERRLEAYRRLLEINLLVPLGHGPRLGVDSESGKVLCAFQFKGSTAPGLLACLELAAQQALQWRATFYLDQASGNDPRHALACSALRA